MKKIIILMSLVASITSFAKPNCVDQRAALIEPCHEGEKYFFVNGKCSEPYEFETYYCAVLNEPECTDQRSALIEPCPEGKKLTFVQGQCAEKFEFEHHYCR
jgi:hypothetical protein